MIDTTKVVKLHNLIERYYELTGAGVDVLIEKLTELTHPKTKYEAGDETFFLFDMDIQTMIIMEVKTRINGHAQWYRTNQGFVSEDNLFPTKQSLIEAQIKYWKEMLYANK